MICLLKSTTQVADCCLPITEVTWTVTDGNSAVLYNVTGLPTSSGTVANTPFVGGTLDEPNFDFAVLSGVASPITITKSVKDSCCVVGTYSQQYIADNTGQFECVNCDDCGGLTGETLTFFDLSGDSLFYRNELGNLDEIKIQSSGQTATITYDNVNNIINIEVPQPFAELCDPNTGDVVFVFADGTVKYPTGGNYTGVTNDLVSCCCKEQEIPMHRTDCLHNIAFPNPLPNAPLTTMTPLVLGSTIREEFMSGYIIWTYNGTDWDRCGRDFLMGGGLTPAK